MYLLSFYSLPRPLVICLKDSSKIIATILFNSRYYRYIFIPFDLFSSLGLNTRMTENNAFDDEIIRRFFVGRWAMCLW